MLGAVAFVMLILAVAFGFEVGSPGFSAAAVKAGVWTTHAVVTHVDAKICAELVRLGQTAPACPQG